MTKSRCKLNKEIRHQSKVPRILLCNQLYKIKSKAHKLLTYLSLRDYKLWWVLQTLAMLHLMRSASLFQRSQRLCNGLHDTRGCWEVLLKLICQKFSRPILISSGSSSSTPHEQAKLLMLRDYLNWNPISYAINKTIAKLVSYLLKKRLSYHHKKHNEFNPTH